MRVILHCKKISRYDREKDSLIQSNGLSNKIEKIKFDQDIKPSSESYQIFVSCINDLNVSINSISIKLQIELKLLNRKLEHEHQIISALPPKGQINDFLFDVSGLNEVVIKLISTSYSNDRQQTNNQIITNMPSLVDTINLQNNYGGFRSEKESKARMLLESYICIHV